MPGNNLFQLRGDLPPGRPANPGIAAEPGTRSVSWLQSTLTASVMTIATAAAPAVLMSPETAFAATCVRGWFRLHAGLIAASGPSYTSPTAVTTPLPQATFLIRTRCVTVSLPPSPFASHTQCSGNGTTATYTYTAGSQQFFAGDTVYVSGCAANGLNGSYTVTGASGGSFSVANCTNATDDPESDWRSGESS